MKKALLPLLVVGLCLLAGCGGGSTSGGGGGGNPPTLVSIAVAPATPSISSGATQQFTATGTYSDGSTKSLTSTANWGSSTLTVATINASGLATGVSGGTTTISASVGAISGNTTLTVVALQSITVAPSNPTVAPNGIQQFTATGNYSNGSTQNLTSTVTWSASTGATITAGGLATGVTPGATSTITAKLGSISGTTTLTVSNPLMSIAVTPQGASINQVAPGNTQQYTAIGTFANGTTQDLTATTNWQSSNSNIAAISAGGLATGVSPGSVTISATTSGITGSTSLTVNKVLLSIAVTPANSSVHIGTKPQFTAIGTYSDNSSNDITTQVTWASSNTSAATISNAQGTQGLATAVAAGQTTIKATLGTVFGSTVLTVSSASITSILVTPANSPMSLGLQQQYDAVATFNDGTTQDVTNIVTWSSSDTTKVTITTSGLATAVGVTGSNPVTITATAQNGVFGFTTVTVNAANLVSIAIRPSNITKLAQGTSQQFQAIGTFNNGSTLDLTNQVTWAITPSGLATVIQRTGLVTVNPSIAQNTLVTLSATLQSITGSQQFTVTNATPVPPLTVTPVSATIQAGATQTYHATAVFNDGTSQDVTINSAWTSSNTSEAIVTAPGRLQGVATTTSPVTVTATFAAVSGTASLNVSSATLTSITVSPPSANLAPGSSTSFQATGNYSDGSMANLTGLATWRSSATQVATVSNGVVLGQSAGSATITASYQGQQGSASVLVTSSALTSIAITPANPTTYIGVSLSLTATGTAGAQQINLTPSATWASSSPSVATVSNANSRQGVVTGVGTGNQSSATTTITAVFGQITGTTTLTVTNATITSLAVTPVNSTISVGTTQSFRAVGTFSDGNMVDLTTQVTWTSSAPNVAPINSTNGVASGATVGSTTITATFTQPGQQPVSNQTTLTVQ